MPKPRLDFLTTLHKRRSVFALVLANRGYFKGYRERFNGRNAGHASSRFGGSHGGIGQPSGPSERAHDQPTWLLNAAPPLRQTRRSSPLKPAQLSLQLALLRATEFA